MPEGTAAAVLISFKAADAASRDFDIVLGTFTPPAPGADVALMLPSGELVMLCFEAFLGVFLSAAGAALLLLLFVLFGRSGCPTLCLLPRAACLAFFLLDFLATIILKCTYVGDVDVRQYAEGKLIEVVLLFSSIRENV